jgi:hypothetical protein
MTPQTQTHEEDTMVPDIIRTQARSAITGRWISKRTASRWPEYSVVETIRYPSRPRPKSTARHTRG